MKIARYFLILILMVLAFIPFLEAADDPDANPGFSNPNIVWIRMGEGVSTINPKVRGGFWLQLGTGMQITSDVYTSSGATIAIDTVGGITTLDQAYNNSPSANKTITVDDGAVTLTSAFYYGEIFKAWGGTYGFHLYDDGFFAAIGNSGGGTVLPYSGAGTRMFWYPQKASLRAGQVGGAQWDDANIGNPSIGLGTNTLASGSGSTAFGVNTTASGSYSTSTGNFTVASGVGSNASGGYCDTAGDYSFASGYYMGLSNAADYSTIFGYAASLQTMADPYTFYVYGNNVIINEGGGAYTTRMETDSYANAFDLVDAGLTIGSGVTMSGDTDTAGYFKAWDGSANFISFAAPARATDLTYNYPTADPSTYDGFIKWSRAAGSATTGAWVGDKQLIQSQSRTPITTDAYIWNGNIQYSATIGTVMMEGGTITGISASGLVVDGGSGAAEFVINVYLNGAEITAPDSNCHLHLTDADQSAYITFTNGTYIFSAGDEMQIYVENIYPLTDMLNNLMANVQIQN